MNRGELRADILGNHGNIQNKDSVVNTILTHVVDVIGRVYEWHDLLVLNSEKTLAAAGYSIALADTVRIVKSPVRLLASGTWYDVELYSREEFRRMNSAMVPATSGTPDDCVQIGRSLHFNKKADVQYTVYMDAIKYPVAMSNDDATPSIYGVDHIIVAAGTGWLYLHRHLPASADPWFSIANALLSDLVGEVVAPFKVPPKQKG